MSRKPEFVHLHNHTEYSRQDGLQKLDEMCRVAAEDGQPAIAGTDHGTLAGAYQLVMAAKKYNIKPVLGEEVYLAIGSREEQETLADEDDGSEADEGALDGGKKERKYHHLTVLAADSTGWKNLVRLHNDAAEHFWHKPRTDMEALGEYHEGLIVGTGCLGGPVASRFLSGDDEGAYAAANALLEAVGGDRDRLFVEIMSHGIDVEDQLVTPKLVSLAKKMGLRLVASNDAHYTHGCDQADGLAELHYGHGCEPEAHDLLLALGTNSQRDDKKRYRFNGHGYHLRTAAEMDAVFSRIDGAQDAVRNSLVIADMVEPNVMGLTSEKNYHLPKFPVPETDVAEYETLVAAGDTRFTSASNYHLVKSLKDKAAERYGLPLPEKVKTSLNFENKVIRNAGMDDYMLIVSDLLDWARDQGIVTGPGRGCLAGESLVWTERGYVPISEVQVGDAVRTHTGGLAPVSDTLRYDVTEDLVRLRTYFDGGSGIAMTTDHKVLTVPAEPETNRTLLANGNRWKPEVTLEPRWVPAGDVQVGDLLCVPRPASPGTAPESIDLGELLPHAPLGTIYEVGEHRIVERRRVTHPYPASVRDVSASTGVGRNTIASVRRGKSRTTTHVLERLTTHVASEGFESLEGWFTYLDDNAYVEVSAPRAIEVDDDLLFLLGAWASNGWTRTDSTRVTGWATRRSTDDGRLPAALRRVFGIEPHVSDHARTDLRQYIVRSATVAALFESLAPGYAQKASTKALPDWVSDLDVDDKRALLDGLWWGDGSVAGGRWSYTSASPRLIQQVRDLLWAIGAPAGIQVDDRTDDRPGYENRGLAWKVRTSPAMTAPRPQFGAVDGTYVYLRVTGSEAVTGVSEVFDLTVPGDHSFMTDSYVVHNSAVGSVMAYSSGITDVEPVEHNLLFERFLDPTRVGMPDIDSDFDRAGRALVLKQVEEKYGHDRVALIGTRGTYKAKGAVRHVGRLTGRTEAGAALAEQVWSKAGFTANLAKLVDPEEVESAGFREVLQNVPEAATVLALARTIEGTRSDVGIHACGVLVCDESMLDQVPLRRDAKSGMWVTEWEGPELDDLGYLKLDILGLRTLDVVSTCLEMMRDSGIETPDITYRGIEIDPETSPRARAAWELIGAGDTEGVFQLASDGMRQLAQQVQPRHLGDLSALVALYRPGPMGAGMHEKYGDRKHGREPVSYDYLTTDPTEQAVIAAVLDDTFGLIIYQEQIMTLSGVVAGFGPSAKNKLRKAFSKKDKEQMAALAEQFISGATSVTEDGEDSTASIVFRESTARELWRTFSASAEYLFNRCVFFDTEVVNGKNLRWTVEQLYFRLYGNDDASPDLCPFCEERPRARNTVGICGRCRSWHTMFNDPTRGFHLLAHDSTDGRIRPQRVAGVHANGIKDVIRLTTASGRSIRVTDNHRMLTPDGYVEAGRLGVGDELVSHGGYERQVHKPSDRTTVGERRRAGKVGHSTPELGYNYIDGGYLALKTWTEETIDTAACDECGMTRDQGRLERAHLDGDRTNNVPSNLAWKCVSHHKSWDYSRNGRRRQWDKGHLAGIDAIVSIEHGGRGMTYDVEMAEGTDHNFVANGLISHNSHSAAYGFVGYITAYLKANWPSHFGAATLATTSDDEKRADILRSLRNQGIEVRPPSVVDGQVSTWVAADGAVVLGLGEVDGVGENAHAIVSARETKGKPFESLSALVNGVKVTTSRQSQDKTEYRSASTVVCHRCTGLVVGEDTVDADTSAFEACACSSPLTRPGEDHEPPVHAWTDTEGTNVETKLIKVGKNYKLRRTERRPVLDEAGQPVMDESWLSLGIIESLIKAGACDAFGPRLGQLAVVRALREQPDLPVPDVDAGVIERERVAREKLGVTIGAGPFGHRELGRAVLDWDAPDPLREAGIIGVHRVRHQGWYLVGGVLDRWNVRYTRKGTKMASFTLSDSKGSMDGVMWESGLEELEKAGTTPQVGDVVVVSAKAKDRTITRTVRTDDDASIDTDTGEEIEQVTETVTVRELSGEEMWVFSGDVGARDGLAVDTGLAVPMPRVHRTGERLPSLPQAKLLLAAETTPELLDETDPPAEESASEPVLEPAYPRVVSVANAMIDSTNKDLRALMPTASSRERNLVAERITKIVSARPGGSNTSHEFDLDLVLPSGSETITVLWSEDARYVASIA